MSINPPNTILSSSPEGRRLEGALRQCDLIEHAHERLRNRLDLARFALRDALASADTSPTSASSWSSFAEIYAEFLTANTLVRQSEQAMPALIVEILAALPLDVAAAALTRRNHLRACINRAMDAMIAAGITPPDDADDATADTPRAP